MNLLFLSIRVWSFFKLQKESGRVVKLLWSIYNTSRLIKFPSDSGKFVKLLLDNLVLLSGELHLFASEACYADEAGTEE